MYIPSVPLTLLALATGLTVSATPVSVSEASTVVNVPSSSYSSLIVYNPTTTAPSDTIGQLLTPTGVEVPTPSPFSLQGDVPSVSSSSPSTSTSQAGGTNESGGVRVVGSSGTTEDMPESGDRDSSAAGVKVGSWMGIAVGMGVVLGSGWV